MRALTSGSGTRLPREVSTMFLRNGDGDVVSWGPPNRQHLVERPPQPGVHVDPAWSVVWVTVWVQWADPQNRGYGWHEFGTFAAEGFERAAFVFDEYYGTAGLYNRASFSSEQWIWTEAGGWEPEDHC